jgi:hypothetical protein
MLRNTLAAVPTEIGHGILGVLIRMLLFNPTAGAMTAQEGGCELTLRHDCPNL